MRNSQDTIPTSSDRVNLHIGRRIRVRRVWLEMSPVTLGETVGVTPRQIEAYEMGTAHLSASRLLRIADALEVPASYFFNDRSNEFFDDKR